MKKLKEKLKYGKKGITLIALVITIIVLLILAGVTIAALSGDNGILQNAARAKEESEKAEIIEQIRLDISDKQIENQGSISIEEFYEILRKYGSISSDETILTTTKGKYKILISDIYSGKIESSLITTPISSWEYEIRDTSVRLKKYIGTDTDIFIPNTFEIGGNTYSTVLNSSYTTSEIVFYSNNIIKTVKFGNSVTIAGNNAYALFYGCNNLEQVYNYPVSVTNFSNIFHSCSKLKYAADIPEGVTTLNYAFTKCSSLVSAPEISSTVQTMNYTFQECINLTGDVVINSDNINSATNCFATTKKLITLIVNKDSTTYTTFDSIIDTWDSVIFYGETNTSIACWGDSLTYGAGSSSTTYPSMLKNQWGRFVSIYKLGVGGEKSNAIAARQGGLEIFANDFTIPSSTTAVEITIQDANGDEVILRSSNNCTIDDVDGTIAYDGDSGLMYFTRNSKGIEKNVSSGEKIIMESAEEYRNTDVNIIWSGQNDTNITDNIDKLIRTQQSMINYSNSKKYIVIGLLYAGDDVNNKMADAYGEHFLDVRNALSVDNSNTVSEDYKADSVHLNADGYTIVGEQVYNKLISLGYITE